MEEIVGYVLGLRQSPPARAALRRASSPSTEHYAYGYLAPWWRTHKTRKAAILAFAGLAAAVPSLEQDAKTPVGTMVANIVLAGKMTEDSAARKLTVAQSAQLPQLVVLLRSFLKIGASAGQAMDYNSLYWLLSMSTSPNTQKRSESRRRLLEDFYQQLDLRRNKDDIPLTGEVSKVSTIDSTEERR